MALVSFLFRYRKLPWLDVLAIVGQTKQQLLKYKQWVTRRILNSFRMESRKAKLLATWIQMIRVVALSFCVNFAGSHTQKDSPAWGESCIKYGEKKHFAVKCFKHSSGKTAAKSSKQRNKEQLVHGLSEISFSEEYRLPVSSRVIGATLNALPTRDYKRGYDDPQLKELEYSAILSITMVLRCAFLERSGWECFT